ncbi:MAG: DUF1566 domain-containing protein [Acidobacteria bacterium]|nr:DUF1566 domain-containing protein [Acidobacteriota bacterium]
MTKATKAAGTRGPGRLALALVLAGVSLAAWFAIAGELDQPLTPSDNMTAMYTLRDIWNRLTNNVMASKRPLAFVEPTAGPSSTGKTLDEVYAAALPTKVPKTGQTPTVPIDPAPAGSDGALQKGVPWPAPRFADNGDGTVTDNLTGLIWLKKADCGTLTGLPTSVTWDAALLLCSELHSGHCGLTDGSVAGDWRLPSVRELSSLPDYRYIGPALCNTAGTGQWTSGDPFTVQTFGTWAFRYWSSSTLASDTSQAWTMEIYNGALSGFVKSTKSYVWPVRGGQ